MRCPLIVSTLFLLYLCCFCCQTHFWDLIDEKDTSLVPFLLFPGIQIEEDIHASREILNNATMAISSGCHRQLEIVEEAWHWDIISAWTQAYHRLLSSFLSVKSGFVYIRGWQSIAHWANSVHHLLPYGLWTVSTWLKKIRKKVITWGHRNMVRKLNFSGPQ